MRRSLSVSPIGSSPLQPAHRRGRWHDGSGFQYPQSDRALCNRLGRCPARPSRRLSVSPIGSSPLQLPQVVYSTAPLFLSVSPIGSSPLQPTASHQRGVPYDFPLSVSPIGSSPLQLAHRRGGLSGWYSTFSIPNRIEPSATETIRLDLAGLVQIFQYPQSDRALCNGTREHWIISPDTSFSIPNRIEPSATY